MTEKACYWWYWGNKSTVVNTCLNPKRKPYRSLCDGKCKLFTPNRTQPEILVELAKSLTK